MIQNSEEGKGEGGTEAKQDEQVPNLRTGGPGWEVGKAMLTTTAIDEVDVELKTLFAIMMFCE